MTRVFVYGTLKEGGRLHGNIQGLDGKLLRKVTLSGFDLYRVSWFPGIVKGKGNVEGELYEFADQDATLHHLDHVEGAPFLFKRETVRFDDGPAEVYVYNRFLGENAEKIETGVWPI